MKKLIILCLLIVVLTACGRSSNDDVPNDSETVTVYNNDDTLTHQMEGVNLTLDYNVKKLTGKVGASNSTQMKQGDFVIELTAKITNSFEREIYYSPSFLLQTSNNRTLEQISSTVDKQIEVTQGTEETFTTTYLLSKEDYERNSELNLHIPAAFKEPNSESSGDALGDFTNWIIVIK